MRRRFRARGLTLVELVGVIIVAVIVSGVLLVGVTPRRHGCGRHMKDAVQVRGIQQAMAVWANSNNGLFPLPSKIDAANATVPEEGAAKDTTANILSILIYTGGISPELTISAAESNTWGIVMDDDYEFDAPKAAVDPANALWDPAFSSDFTGGKVSNNSFAHITPTGERWRDTFLSWQPVIGNRGPEIASITRDALGRVKPTYVDTDSNTFLIHGARNSWEGSVAYNDNHVNFEVRVDPEGVTYAAADGRKLTDCLFFREADDPKVDNVLMSLWVKGGDTPLEFKGIWD